jgi:coproporphyrinogen III oxidase
MTYHAGSCQRRGKKVCECHSRYKKLCKELYMMRERKRERGERGREAPVFTVYLLLIYK